MTSTSTRISTATIFPRAPDQLHDVEVIGYRRAGSSRSASRLIGRRLPARPGQREESRSVGVRRRTIGEAPLLLPLPAFPPSLRPLRAERAPRSRPRSLSLGRAGARRRRRRRRGEPISRSLRPIAADAQTPPSQRERRRGEERRARAEKARPEA